MSQERPEAQGPDYELGARLAREATFHDAKYSGSDLYPRHYAVRPTEYVYTEMSRMLGDLSGKKVLEYGCGEGWITRDLASQSAEVFAFDVSERSIDTTRAVLTKSGLLTRCHLQVMPAEALNYPDESIDVAVGFAIIHHLDLPRALAELHRVLRPGGLAYFAEPLGTNPAIQLYRRFTPHYRTSDERPLVLSELPYLLRKFTHFHHQEFYLTALAALALAYAPGGQKLFPSVSARLHSLDKALLQRLPKLGRFAWYTVIRIEK
jgi:SAM-dependent methyltransferase